MFVDDKNGTKYPEEPSRLEYKLFKLRKQYIDLKDKYDILLISYVTTYLIILVYWIKHNVFN